MQSSQAYALLRSHAMQDQVKIGCCYARSLVFSLLLVWGGLASHNQSRVLYLLVNSLFILLITLIILSNDLAFILYDVA